MTVYLFIQTQRITVVATLLFFFFFFALGLNESSTIHASSFFSFSGFLEPFFFLTFTKFVLGLMNFYS